MELWNWVPVPAEYSKRVYQGVRVKHTVKDLLAEKRSRQTSSSRFNGSVSTAQTSYVPLPGSPSLSGYYGVRRSLVADTDLQGNKQIPSDVYPSSLLAKPLTHDSPTVQGYPSLLDSHFIDQYTDHRAAANITSGASPFFGSSSLASVMASFPSDSTYFLTKDSWDPAMPDSFSQSDACPDPFQVSSSSGCISTHESGSSQSRTPSWNSPISGTQPYSFHALEDVHYAAGYSAASPYSFPSFVTTVPSDVTFKMPQASSEEPSDTAAVHDNTSLWPKDDGNSLWASYECRRTY